MKKTLFWTLAVIITLVSAYYQRKTGPTYPKEIETQLHNQTINFELTRSGISSENLLVDIPLLDTTILVQLKYRRFPVNEPFKTIDFNRNENNLSAYLPKQPPAGKLEYYISFRNKITNKITESEHVVVRFKGDVPGWALIPHILFMFVAMLLSNLAGLFAIGKIEKHVFYGKLTLTLLLLGGMIFGPIVQHYAFGQAWTGIPLGWDLTDNKTLFAVIFWVIAIISNRKEPRYRYTIMAAVVLFLIYIIPHSLFGSELDYESGKVVTGIISLLL